MQKEELDYKLVKRLKWIVFTGLGLTLWTMSMFLVLIIAHDINKGAELLSFILVKLFQLYTIFLGIVVFVSIIDYILYKKSNNVKKTVRNKQTKNKNK